MVSAQKLIESVAREERKKKERAEKVLRSVASKMTKAERKGDVEKLTKRIKKLEKKKFPKKKKKSVLHKLAEGKRTFKYKKRKPMVVKLRKANGNGNNQRPEVKEILKAEALGFLS